MLPAYKRVWNAGCSYFIMFNWEIVYHNRNAIHSLQSIWFIGIQSDFSHLSGAHSVIASFIWRQSFPAAQRADYVHDPSG